MFLNWLVALCVFCDAVRFASNQLSGPTTNVRTVLFTKHDARQKTCWSREEIGLLFARYVMQDLLPRKVPSNVTYLNQYMAMCVRTINDGVSSESAVQLLVHAFSDAFGGYLHGFGLPLARQAYYEGTVDMVAVEKLYKTEHSCQDYLKTDGQSWAKPMRVKEPLGPIRPMKIHMDKSYDYCDELILSPLNDDDEPDQGGCDREEFDCPNIPIPFFDDCKEPRAVAVPLREQCLHSLTCAASQGILSKYYELSINCINNQMHSKYDCQHCTKAFNSKFSKWMRGHLVRHLRDDKWYAALHGVLRVLKTAEQNATQCPAGVVDEHETSSAHFALIVGFLLGLFWLIILLCLLCRYCCTFRDNVNECDDDCRQCVDRNCNEKPARLFMYNLACWARPPEKGSSTEWCKCSEPNYVDVERYESDTSTGEPVKTKNENYVNITEMKTMEMVSDEPAYL